MQQRFAALSRNGKILTGLIALLLSCGLCSRLLPEPASKTGSTDEPTVGAATEEPISSPTEETEATSTAPATDPVEATATEVPTDEPTTEPATAVSVQATALPAYYSLDPLEDRDCSEFPSQAAAQSYWEYHRTVERPNPGRLDGNGNSVVCEDPDRASRQAPAQEQAAPPPAAPGSGCVNFNSAGYDDLRRIKHVDDKIANEILKKRPFSGWDDLVDEVNGIGENNVKDIQAEGLGCF